MDSIAHLPQTGKPLKTRHNPLRFLFIMATLGIIMFFMAITSPKRRWRR